MGRVIWSSKALDDLEEIRVYIAQFDPAAADRLWTRIVACAASLETFPNRGRPLANGDRQLTTVRPYQLRYRLAGDVVVVRGVRHGARRPLGRTT